MNSKVFQRKHERVIFDCNVNSNPPSAVHWYKNRARIAIEQAMDSNAGGKYAIESLSDSFHRLYINVSMTMQSSNRFE